MTCTSCFIQYVAFTNVWVYAKVMDLFMQMHFYHCHVIHVVRDVLAVCLSIPRWIYSVTGKDRGRLSQLEPGELFSYPCPFVSRPLPEDVISKV